MTTTNTNMVNIDIQHEASGGSGEGGEALTITDGSMFAIILCICSRCSAECVEAKRDERVSTHWRLPTQHNHLSHADTCTLYHHARDLHGQSPAHKLNEIT